MNATAASAPKWRTWLLPCCLVVLFTAVLQSLGLSEFVSLVPALLAGLGWGIAIALIAIWLRSRVRPSAWVEDALVAFGAVAMGFLAFGGGAGLLLWRNALDSSSVTGETMVAMFLPSIPLAIATNAPMELIVVPGLLILGWRRGARRILIVAAAALFFVHRVWTYLVFASVRLDFAQAERSTAPLSEPERREFADALQLDDPRWILNLAIFGVFLLAAFLSRVRELTPAPSSA